MQLFEIYKSLYEHEVNIRNVYDGKITFTYALLSFTGGTIAYIFAFVFNSELHGYLMNFMQIALGFSISIFCGQLFLSFKAYFSFKYKYKDFPVDLIRGDIVDKIMSSHYKTVDELENKMDLYISGMLFRTYEKCATAYYQTNIRKRKAHHILNIFSFLNLILIILMNILIIYLKKGG